MNQSATSPIFLSPVSRFTTQEHCASSPSPSRSSKRPQQFTSVEPDPLLANLSPTSTLKALYDTNTVLASEVNGRSALSNSIADASTSERALGIRAALAGKKLRDWYNEVKGWKWPSTGFERRLENEEMRQRRPTTHGGLLDQILAQDPSFTQEEEGIMIYWGSMPADDVQAYERRIEAIRDEMEKLDVEELKDHVRGAYLLSRTRPQSDFGVENSDSVASVRSHLDDFTAIITVTIMQALPYIFRLNALLDLWTTRLTVLRYVPGWSIRIEDSKVAMEAAWTAIGRDKDATAWVPSDLSRKAFDTMKSILVEMITELGQRTDVMLDLLEGGVDHLPDIWIDRLEQLEEDYKGWAVDAERIMLDNEWKQNQAQCKSSVPSEARENSISTLSAELSPLTETGTTTKFDRGTEAYNEVLAETTHPLDSGLIADDAGSKNKNESDLRNLTPETVEQTIALDSISHQQLTAISNEKSLPEDHISKGLATVPYPESTSIPAMNSALRETRKSSEESLNEKKSVELPIPQPNYLPSTLVNNEDFPNHHTKNLEESSEIDYFSLMRTENSEPESTIEPTLIASHHLASKPSANMLLVHRPTPFDLKRETFVYDSNFSSELSYPGSASSGNFSNMSSPEILSASRVEYFGTPTEIKTPIWAASREPLNRADTMSRHSSQSTEIVQVTKKAADVPSKSASPLHARSRASSFLPELNVNNESDLVTTVQAQPTVTSDSESDRPAPILKRASTTSIEVLPKRELRRLTLTRSGSHSSSSSALDRVKNEGLPSRRSSVSGVFERSSVYTRSSDTTPSSPCSTTDDVPDQSPSVRLYNKKKSNVSSQLQPDLPFGFPKVPTNSTGRIGQLPYPKTRSISSKTDVEKKAGNLRSIKASRTYISNSPNEQLSKQVNVERKNGGLQGIKVPGQDIEDQLEAKIHSILTNIPARIRLTSGSVDDALDVRRPRANSSSKPGITLVPAEASSTSKLRSESEIKLYHLHQPGKEVPIKLYVRLVGESGERVMVRVGGGWADLGEYLKEYAIHHGRRSISDGRFEIRGLSTTQSAMSVNTLATFKSGQSTPSTPGSPEFFPSSSIQNRRLRLSDASPTDFKVPNTPEVSAYKQQDATPGSADSFASRSPPSRMSWTDDDVPLGLAGPTSKKKQISPGKRAWVEGMLDQAKKASAEKRRSEGGDIGDLGKVGGTRRVFLKAKKDNQ